ncbi:type II toxin-antitoxin system PemK/MazF family toxin [Knoellia sinensis]|uniref:type II toxin-antitoxin system PemK/MazF family toxin n=1 Tax=Knoellia sinensis TaxID=136100 RepID=UPI002480617F|nr:type II toxin-antitoxin system PemK/MazF family toxin [Knoellia sinensis]
MWWCETPHFPRRPVILLSRSAAVHGLGRTLVAPCTTTIRGLPSEVELDPGSDPVPLECVAALDAVESVSVATLVERIGRLSDARMSEICRALGVAVACG